MLSGTGGLFEQDVLEAVVGCRRHVNTAHADVWEYVASFCTSAAFLESTAPTAGVVHSWSYGGAGTPEVPEGAVLELAAQLGESREAMTRVVAVAMNLWHRLGRIRYAVELGDVDWRKAELVAAGTLHVSEAVAAGVQDALLPEGTDPEASLLARITRRRLADVIAQVQATVDEDAVEDDVEAALEARDVSIGRSEAVGVTEVHGTLSTEDGTRLAQRVRQVARWLRETGDDRRAGIRRSVALGMLADPARLQDLWEQVRTVRAEKRARSTDDHIDDDLHTDDDADALPSIPPAGIPGTKLFVHLDAESRTWTLDGTSASDPCAGVLSRAEAIRLVGHDRLTITPVLDLAAELTYTSYAAPPKLRAQLAMRNQGRCAFPHCDRHASIPAGSSSVDYDHSPPWPEGTTSSTCGAMLCEPHHRAKTFLRWDVRQVTPGSWVWHAPRGRRYLVTAGTTVAL